MKIRRTVKEHYYDRPLWPKPVDAGAVEIITDRERMDRIFRGTHWLFEDCKEVDPATKSEFNPTGSTRPPERLWRGERFLRTRESRRTTRFTNCWQREDLEDGVSKELFSPEMRAAIDHALKHSGGVIGQAVLVRFPGGFWSHKDWRSTNERYFGTTTIEAVVKRGAGFYSQWQERKNGSKFPVEVTITL